MSDLFEDPAADQTPGSNAHEFTVSEISGAVKKTLEGEFGRVRVRGEVGRTLLARSGHLYFDLKDDRAVIASVSWKGQAARLAITPEEGMEVIATGRLTTYPGQSKYQLIVDEVEPAGAGALMAMLEKRKKALEAEGLFAAERKKPLPYLPEVIGVVTSPSGAVIRDILHRLRDRFPRKVLVWPVAVQGKDSAAQVARAIAGFNALTPGGSLPRPDLLIVARGGGSVEDLWGFNEEIVARAAAASDIPLISAVGHETDTTLIDFVSDHRAPTPTAAAERAVPVRLELLAWLREAEARLSRSAQQATATRRQRLADMARAMPGLDNLLDGPKQRLDRACERLPAALRQVTQVKRQALTARAALVRPEALAHRLAQQHQRLDDRARRLASDVLARQITRAGRDLQGITKRFARAASAGQSERQQRLASVDRMRQSLGYKATLQRGYAVVRGGGGLVATAKAAQAHSALEIEFADTRIDVQLAQGAAPSPTTPNSTAPKAKAPTRPPKAKKPPSDQGDLF